jgi:TRAP-type C4-dicarboxylate transport system substrate-binding protein
MPWTQVIGALYVFGFKNLLSQITFTDIVQDAQMYFCNLEWFSRLPQPLRASIDFASEMTMRQNHAKVPAARAHAEMQMTSAGVKLHRLSPDEKSTVEAESRRPSRHLGRCEKAAGRIIESI